MAVRWLIGLLLGLAACPVAAAWAESAARITGPIRGGAHGFPFASTVLDLAAAGYVEEEFFVEGSASGYASDGELAPNGSWTVKVASHSPYKTRILVRRPADQSRFNGTLVVEWLNVSGGGDNPADWAFVHPLLLARGYAWVGVSAQSVGVVGFPPEHPRSALGEAGALKTWDAERYGSLSHPGDTYSYDIFAQVGRALRVAGDVDPLGGLQVARVLAIGVSQSAARLATYINAVQALAKANDLVYFSRRDITDVTSPTGLHYKFTGYLLFDYFITDEQGDATVLFETGSCYHVLWKTTQRTHTGR